MESGNKSKKESENESKKEPEKKSKKKLYIIVVIVAVIAIAIGALIYVNSENQRKEDLANNKTALEEELNQLNELESDIYFPQESKEEITTLEEKAEAVDKDNDLDELKSLVQQSKDLNEELKEIIDSRHENYSNIKTIITKLDDLEKDYFADQYDLRKINEDKQKAQKAIDDLDFDEFKPIAKALDTQLTSLEEFIKEKQSAIYSVPTGINKEFPFAINEEDLMKQWFYPTEKRTVSYPTDFYFNESQILGEPAKLQVGIDHKLYDVDYSITLIPTKEIKVKTPDGSIQTALVNDEMTMTVGEEWVYSEYMKATEQPAYLFEDKDGLINFALKDTEGGDFYVLYTLQKFDY